MFLTTGCNVLYRCCCAAPVWFNGMRTSRIVSNVGRAANDLDAVSRSRVRGKWCEIRDENDKTE